MEIIYWNNSDWITEEQKLSCQDKNSGIFVKGMLMQYQDTVPQLQSVEIETINRCNNDCSFCPVSKENDLREPMRMPEELFYKIIDELAEMEYKGYLSLFSNNEPLLDTRILDFLAYAVEKLPDAVHAMYTNGMLLAKEKYLRLTELLNYLVIDNYNDEFALNEPIRQIVEMEQENPRDSKASVRIEVRRKNQVLSNRGGNAPNKPGKAMYSSACILPFMQMVIRPDGKVSRCCQDAYGRVTAADVLSESIRQAWESQAYRQARKSMLAGGRGTVKGCGRCDVFGLGNYFPLSWIHGYTQTFIRLLWEQKKKGKKLMLIASCDMVSDICGFLSYHGIYPGVLSEDGFGKKADEFYILLEYNWQVLRQFDLDEIGERIVIYEHPAAFLLQKEAVSGMSDRELFSRIRQTEREGRLAVFGAGKNAARLEEKYRFDAVCYLDNNKERAGTLFLGRKVEPADAVKGAGYLILVAANDYAAIRMQLKEMGIADSSIVNGNRLL